MSADEPLVRVDNLQKYFWEQDSVLDRVLGAEPRKPRRTILISRETNSGSFITHSSTMLMR